MPSPPVHIILYLEDDEDDVELVQSALMETSHHFILHRAYNGKNGLDALNNLYKEGQLPCIIIIDIHMPLYDGKEFYKEITSDSRFKAIPLVILTSSNNKKDADYFERNVPFFIKPLSYETLKSLVQKIVELCSVHR